MGSVRSQGGGNVLKGGETGGTNFWIGDLVTFGGNGEEGRGTTYGLSEAYRGESSATEGGHDMGDAQGGSGAGSGRTSVVNDLHRETIGKSGTVGGSAAYF